MHTPHPNSSRDLTADPQVFAQSSSASHTFDPSRIQGELVFPSAWMLFANPDHPTAEIPPLFEGYLRTDQLLVAALENAGKELLPEHLSRMPDTLHLHGRPAQGVHIHALNHQVDLRPVLGHPAYNQGDKAGSDRGSDQTTRGQIAVVYVKLHAPKAGMYTLGFGADSWLQVWVNGAEVFACVEKSKPMPQPVSYFNVLVDVQLEAGENLLVARMVPARYGAMLAMAGPAELRRGKTNTILDDPILRGEKEWTSPTLVTSAQASKTLDVGGRLEPLVDDYLIDSMRGDMRHVLHHPQPAEIVLEAQEPWEDQTAYPKIIQHAGRLMLYYRSQRPKDFPADKNLDVTLVAMSDDGVHFTRPKLDHLSVTGHRVNNAVHLGRPAHNFSPFLDTNPAALPHQKFKAVAYHPQGSGIAAYASPDGLKWELMCNERIIDYHFGGFDSQNVAFWDDARQSYFCYFRGATDMWHARARCITVATSPDMIHWSNHRDLTYSDDHLWELYINAISPYVRAPHLFLGTPARFVPHRKKIQSHREPGVSDSLFMSSRDGVHFHRWSEAFVRPTADPLTWTDRNQFCAPGFVQTSPTELSLYWKEHNRQPSCRIRRGVLRVDGFASLHAGGQVGEVLTRPLFFKGKTLTLNHATSAAGSIRCELCDEQGKALSGFTLAESDVLYGNAICETVTWRGSSDVSSLQGRPVRLRLRMQDADVYALQFASES